MPLTHHGSAPPPPENAAEQQYAKAKISVWWDIENCQVPRGCDASAIAQNISSALAKMGYCGSVSVSAYGDTRGSLSPFNKTSIALESPSIMLLQVLKMQVTRRF